MPHSRANAFMTAAPCCMITPSVTLLRVKTSGAICQPDLVANIEHIMQLTTLICHAVDGLHLQTHATQTTNISFFPLPASHHLRAVVCSARPLARLQALALNAQHKCLQVVRACVCSQRQCEPLCAHTDMHDRTHWARIESLTTEHATHKVTSSAPQA